MVLNLDTCFNPLPDEESINFKSFIFSGGEPHIKIDPDFNIAHTITVTHRLNSFNDLGLLCLAVNALKNMGVTSIHIFIPYFPAARQDRLMVPGEPLSVKVYANIINSLNVQKVIVFDPHSEVTPALVNNCHVIHNYAFIEEVIKNIGTHLLLVSPDGGALKKIYKLSEYLGNHNVVECSKSRDVKTGKLSGFKVYHDDLQGVPCLIVDDICDGGGTFVGLAEALKAKGAGGLYLAVSHGIFSKGFEGLESHFTRIYTTNSFRDIDYELVKQVNITL